ncbi:MAG TPA: hypothetical protein VMG34_16115 [Bacteroidota bacterium]|nr:hypothetical protein [Bacteroidota bacterium]
MLLATGVLTTFSQFQVSGEASTSFVKSNDGISQYSFDDGRGTFGWRLDLFADDVLTDDIAFLSNFRMLQDEVPHIDLMAIRISDIAESGVSLQAGEIDVPFGNLSDDRFPMTNPFLGLPLLNEDVTSLCASDYKIWTLNPEYQIVGDGVHLLDQGLYDIGMKVYGDIGIIHYEIALTNGMVSTTGTYSPGGLNSHHGIGKVVRLVVTPMTGVSVGASYANGPFMKDESETINDNEGTPDTSAFYGISPDHYLQNILGADLRYSAGYFEFTGEAIHNTWEYLKGINLSTFGYTAAAKYALTPRLSAALRVGGVSFTTIHNIRELTPTFRPVLYSGKWDHDATRIEGALAYKFTRGLIAKGGYIINRTYGLPKDPVDNVLFIQTVLSFR